MVNTYKCIITYASTDENVREQELRSCSVCLNLFTFRCPDKDVALPQWL